MQNIKETRDIQTHFLNCTINNIKDTQCGLLHILLTQEIKEKNWGDK